MSRRTSGTTQTRANRRAGPDTRAIKEEGRVLSNRFYQEARPRLLEHLHRLQSAASLDDLFEAQRALLVESGARQNVEATLVPQRKELEREIRDVVPMSDRTRLIELQGRLTELKLAQKVFPAIHHALRTIADGIAWKALRYDRLGVAVLGRGRRVGHLASGVGFTTEMNWIEAYWKEGILALHNDLTNVLRHGDLTLVRWPAAGELEADVVEIKTGRVDLTSRQFRRIADAIGFLRDGRHPSLAEGSALVAHRLAAPYLTHQEDLAQVLASARQEGFAWRSLSPSVAIMATWIPGIAERGMSVAQERMVMEEALGWWSGPPDSHPFVWSATHRRLRDRDETVAAIAPSTIFRLPAEDIADLLLGFIDYVTYFNSTVLERDFAARGLSVEVARPPDSEHRFLTAVRPSGSIVVPAHVREQLMVELMTPETLIAAIEGAFAAAGAREPAAHSMVVLDESTTWEQP